MNVRNIMSQENTPPDGNSAQNATEESLLPDSLFGLTVENGSFNETAIKCEKEKIKTIHQWFMVHSLNVETRLPVVSKRVIMCTHCGNISVKQ